MRRAAEWATLNKRTSRARSILSEEYFARSSRSSFVGLSREHSIRARSRLLRSSYFVFWISTAENLAPVFGMSRKKKYRSPEISQTVSRDPEIFRSNQNWKNESPGSRYGISKLTLLIELTNIEIRTLIKTRGLEQNSWKT